jgi:UDP-N-acetylmuramoylalanine-D-glutamate ligase
MAIWLKFKSYIIALVAALSAIVGVYLYGRSSGALREAQKAAQKDRHNARRVEDAADKARTVDGDPIERLRKHGKLRD